MSDACTVEPLVQIAAKNMPLPGLLMTYFRWQAASGVYDLPPGSTANQNAPCDSGPGSPMRSLKTVVESAGSRTGSGRWRLGMEMTLIRPLPASQRHSCCTVSNDGLQRRRRAQRHRAAWFGAARYVDGSLQRAAAMP